MRRIRSVWWLLFAALWFACADSPSDGGAGGSGGTAGTGGTGGTGGVGGDGGTGGSGGDVVIPTDEFDTGWEPEVPDAIYEDLDADPRPAGCTPEYDYVAKVRGWIAAPGGKPLPGAFAQLCVYNSSGAYVCLSPAMADDDGVYTVDVPEAFRCVESVAMRVLLPLSHRATVYCPFEPGDEPVTRLEMPTVLPFAMPVEDLPPLGNEDEAREVVLHDGMRLQVTPSLFVSGSSSYDKLGGRRIPTDAVGLCGEASEFDGLYAFHPEDWLKEPGFPFSIENATGLPAGARVEFLALGGLDSSLFDGTKVPEGEWAVFGEGEVSEDGAIIVADEGVGLPFLTWLAYRLKE